MMDSIGRKESDKKIKINGKIIFPWESSLMVSIRARKRASKISKAMWALKKARGFLYAKDHNYHSGHGWMILTPELLKYCNGVEIPDQLKNANAKRLGTYLIEQLTSQYRSQKQKLPSATMDFEARAQEDHRVWKFYESFEWRRIRYTILSYRGANARGSYKTITQILETPS